MPRLDLRISSPARWAPRPVMTQPRRTEHLRSAPTPPRPIRIESDEPHLTHVRLAIYACSPRNALICLLFGERTVVGPVPGALKEPERCEVGPLSQQSRQLVQRKLSRRRNKCVRAPSSVVKNVHDPEPGVGKLETEHPHFGGGRGCVWPQPISSPTIAPLAFAQGVAAGCVGSIIVRSV